MIVVDASAALTGLLRRGEARQTLATEQLHAPHVVDSEVVSGLRRQVAAGRVDADTAQRILAIWPRLALTRYPVFALVARMWELRENLSAYDASYVALAESLGCPLLTADARLARAPGLRCAVTVVPR
jgi:predicted nucleic acid-binding protein